MPSAPQFNPEAIVELFEHAAETWGSPAAQWVVCLMLLLSGEAQLMIQQHPVMNILEYLSQRQAILQQVSYTPQTALSVLSLTDVQ